jgi:hypothetical protein
MPKGGSPERGPDGLPQGHEPQCIEAPQYLMFRTKFDDLCLKQAQQNEQTGMPINASMLTAFRKFIDVNQHILCNPVVSQQVLLCAQSAWNLIPSTGPTEGST